MYQQVCSPKKASPLKTIITIVILLIFVIALYVGFSFIKTSVHPTSVAGAALLISLLIAYFVTKPSQSNYVYEVDSDTLTIKQVAAKRVVKEIKLNKAEISDLAKGKGGLRLYTSGSVPYTFSAKDKKYTIAPDKTLLSYLENPSFTDAYIDNSFEELLDNLKKLMTIPSVKENPLEGMPFGKPCADALEYTLSLCEEFGMRTKNLDNYCGWAEIGEGEKLIAILCHLDVVPAGDGWNTDPFTAVIDGEELLGRGAIDDKGPALAAIYSVKAVKEKFDNIPARIRIIFGCDEESGWGCMERYAETEETPHMAFTPDAEYPVIITEKGIVHYNIQTSLEEGEYQLYLKGGLRANMVPDKAQATVIGNIDKLFNVLNEYDVHSKGLSFSTKGNVLTIDSVGVGAHGSTPQKGTNAFFELFKFLKVLDLKGSQGQFVDNMVNIFTDKTDGSGANLKLSDEISGELTLNLGMCFIGKNDVFPEMNDDSCKIVIDIRYPVTSNIEDISFKLQSALPNSWECEIEHQQDPHHVDKDSPLVQTLLEVYKNYTGRDEAPLAIGGGTYARTLPGKAVAFGVQFLERPDRAHQPNEGINLEDLKLSTKMFASVLEKLSFN